VLLLRLLLVSAAVVVLLLLLVLLLVLLVLLLLGRLLLVLLLVVLVVLVLLRGTLGLVLHHLHSGELLQVVHLLGPHQVLVHALRGLLLRLLLRLLLGLLLRGHRHGTRGGLHGAALAEHLLGLGLVRVGDLEALVEQRVAVEVLDRVRGREGEAELDEAVALGRAVLAVDDDLDGLDGAVHLEELPELHLVDGGGDVVDHQVPDHLRLRRLAARRVRRRLRGRLRLRLLRALLVVLVVLLLGLALLLLRRGLGHTLVLHDRLKRSGVVTKKVWV